MRYRVVLTQEAREAIRRQARYIALDRKAPEAALRWLRQVLGAVDSLELVPLAGSLAPENALVDYELRMRLVGKYLLLYTVIEADRVVRVVGFRHGARLPRRGDLPESPNG